jgi:hypothetical protein
MLIEGCRYNLYSLTLRVSCGKGTVDTAKVRLNQVTVVATVVGL